jgi:hypothetical protein
MTSTENHIDSQLRKCSQWKLHDYRHRSKDINAQLEQLIQYLERQTVGASHSLEALLNILQVSIAAVDPIHLWRSSSKMKTYDQQLARYICRLYVCLCQLDAVRATSVSGTCIIRSILQWLRDDTDFHLITSIKCVQYLNNKTMIIIIVLFLVKMFI